MITAYPFTWLARDVTVPRFRGWRNWLGCQTGTVSERNVEIVRGAFDAFLRGDMQSALAAFDPDVEWDVTLRADGRVFHGHDGVREGVSAWVDTWDDYRLEIEEYVDEGDDVIVRATESGRGKGSGVEAQQPVEFVWTLNDGKVVRVKISQR